MKRKILIIVFIISTFLLPGCYPDGPDYIKEMDVVLTKYNDTYDFTGKATIELVAFLTLLVKDISRLSLLF